MLRTAVVLSTTACAGMFPMRAQYRMELTEVVRPASATQQYGTPKIDQVRDSGKTKFSFEDRLARVIAFPTSTSFYIVVENKTDHSMKINWDDAAIVPFDGRSMRVVNGSATFATRTQPQPPTVIVRKGRITDMVLPVDNWTFSTYGGTSIEPFMPDLPYTAAQASTTLDGYERQYVGKTVQLLLPLEIEGITNEYVFTFTVRDIIAAPSGPTSVSSS